MTTLPDLGHLGVSAAAYRRMTPEEREGLFEDDIRQIARIDRVLAKASKRRGSKYIPTYFDNI